MNGGFAISVPFLKKLRREIGVQGGGEGKYEGLAETGKEKEPAARLCSTRSHGKMYSLGQ